MILANIVQYSGIVSGAIFSDAVGFNAVLIYLPANGFNILWYVYFYMICKMWADLYTGSGPMSNPG